MVPEQWPKSTLRLHSSTCMCICTPLSNFTQNLWLEYLSFGLCMFTVVIFSVILYLRNNSSNSLLETKIPLSTFEQCFIYPFLPWEISVQTVFYLFPVAATEEALEWQEWCLPDAEHQAQGALLTGTASFPEIARNPTRQQSLIHGSLWGWLTPLQSFLHSHFNYVMDSLFSALSYSLPTICLSCQWLGWFTSEGLYEIFRTLELGSELTMHFFS